MHTLENFVDVGADEEPAVFIDEVISKVKTEKWLNAAREYASRHTETQRQADRLVQEIVIRHDAIDETWILQKLPLVAPEVDHHQIGEHQTSVREDGEYAKVRILIRAVTDLNPDGTVELRWLVHRELRIHKRFWNSLRTSIIHAGDVGDCFLRDPETNEHIDQFIA
jgi:hypothetical protein